MMKMGFIGFGKSANRYHLPYLALRKNIDVKMIYDRDNNYELQKKYPQISFTDDLNVLLNDSEIQLITVASPAFTHFDLGKRVLEAGKNVMIEKPFCSTVDEARTLLAIAKSKGLVATPFQNRRFDGDFLALQSILNIGYIGRPLELESHFDYYRPDEVSHDGPSVEGSFYGLGIHTIDQIVALFGRPDKVSYDIRNNQTGKGIDNYFDAALFFNNLKAIVKTSHVVAVPYPKFILHGTKGTFIKYGMDQQENDLKAGILPSALNFGVDSPTLYGKVKYLNGNGDWIEKTIPTPVGDYGLFYDSLYETIVNQQPKLVSDEELLTTIEILEGGFKKPSPSIYQMNLEVL